MQAWLAALLQPTRTAREKPDPFHWHDQRPVGAQIMGGLRRVAWGATVVAVLIGAFYSMVRISEGPLLIAWASLVACALIMIFTAPRWARFGALGFWFAGKGLIPVLFTRAYLKEFCEFAAFSVAVALLTYRFWKARPMPTTFLDRLALTVFVLCALDAAAIQQVLPALLGLVPLAITFIGSLVHGAGHEERR